MKLFFSFKDLFREGDKVLLNLTQIRKINIREVKQGEGDKLPHLAEFLKTNGYYVVTIGWIGVGGQELFHMKKEDADELNSCCVEL